MKYDFTTIMDRSGRDSIAVDVPFEIPEAKEGFDRIPMWVADMNFPTVPTVQKAMTERIRHSAISVPERNITRQSSAGRRDAIR